MRRIFPAALLLFIAVSVYAQSSQAVELDLKDIKGRTLRLADYKGHVLLINFWATWCIPCRTEIPDLVKLQRQYRKHGLRVVGITYPPENIAEVRRLARELRINYRVVIGTKATKTHFTPSETLPMTVVIDREGNVRDVIEGIMYADEFDQKVRPLLAPKTRQFSNEVKTLEKTRADWQVGCWKHRLASLRKELGYEGAPILEPLDIQQAALCWLKLNLVSCFPKFTDKFSNQ
jgi:thiol-disulfide isomerase/thioredoxin